MICKIAGPALFALLSAGCAVSNPKASKTDDAIQRVDNCVCYKSIKAQNLNPWELAWDSADKLKEQFSHCVCEAQIDIKSVEDPRRYIVPGTVIK